RAAVGIGENGHGADAHLAAGAHDAHGDLTAVGDQDLPEQALLREGAHRSRRGVPAHGWFHSKAGPHSGKEGAMGRILALLLLTATGCGSPCNDLCDHISTCVKAAAQPCDENQCKRICEKQNSHSGELDFSSSAQCVIDTSCDDLAHNACFYTAL